MNLSLLISATRQHKNPIDLFANILLHGSDLPTTSIYTTSVAAESNDFS